MRFLLETHGVDKKAPARNRAAAGLVYSVRATGPSCAQRSMALFSVVAIDHTYALAIGEYGRKQEGEKGVRTDGVYAVLRWAFAGAVVDASPLPRKPGMSLHPGSIEGMRLQWSSDYGMRLYERKPPASFGRSVFCPVKLIFFLSNHREDVGVWTV